MYCIYAFDKNLDETWKFKTFNLRQVLCHFEAHVLLFYVNLLSGICLLVLHPIKQTLPVSNEMVSF